MRWISSTNSTVLGLQVGEDRRQVAGPFEHRPRGHLQRDAHLVGDDVGEGRLAEPGRPEEQHVIERLAARQGRGNEHLQVGGDLLLPDVVGQPTRPQALLETGLRRIAGRTQHFASHAHNTTPPTSHPGLRFSTLPTTGLRPQLPHPPSLVLLYLRPEV